MVLKMPSKSKKDDLRKDLERLDMEDAAGD
jgi:hypothetical protein